MDLLIQLGKRIRELRKNSKFTQSDLAEATGLSTNFIALIEQGKRSPSIETLDKIAKALKVTLDELFYFPSKATKVQEAEKKLRDILKGKDANTILLVAEIAETVLKRVKKKLPSG